MTSAPICVAPDMTPTTNSHLCGATVRLSGESVPIRTIWQRSLYGAGAAARGKAGNALILTGPFSVGILLRCPACEGGGQKHSMCFTSAGMSSCDQIKMCR